MVIFAALNELSDKNFAGSGMSALTARFALEREPAWHPDRSAGIAIGSHPANVAMTGALSRP